LKTFFTCPLFLLDRKVCLVKESNSGDKDNQRFLKKHGRNPPEK
jgi:hypothetical protein